jgi:hypothetical protein
MEPDSKELIIRIATSEDTKYALTIVNEMESRPKHGVPVFQKDHPGISVQKWKRIMP